MNPKDRDPGDAAHEGPAEPSSDGGGGEEASKPVGPRETDSSPQDTSFYDDPYHDESDHLYDDPHADPPDTGEVTDESEPPKSDGADSGGAAPPPPPPTEDEEDDDEDGMARMSFLEHLEELRTRILRGMGGLLIVYLGCLAFARDLLRFVLVPFRTAAESIQTPTGEALKIINTRPLEQFQVVYIYVPLLAAVFIGSPWLMYQAWQFIAPGLYRKEKRWALPFIFATASLFVLGGIFCYFVALPFTLQFLLTVSIDDVEPYIAVGEYLYMFMLLEIGLGLVFQLPVLIFFFTLMRLTSPRFLLRNVRYAVLIMFIVAAIITPTGDPLTMALFAGPMILLYFVGIGASWLLVLRREGRSLPWLRIFIAVLVFFALVVAVALYMNQYHGYGFLPEFPWFGKQ